MAASGFGAEGGKGMKGRTGALISVSRQNSTSIHSNYPGITLSPEKHSKCYSTKDRHTSSVFIKEFRKKNLCS